MYDPAYPLTQGSPLQGQQQPCHFLAPLLSTPSSAHPVTAHPDTQEAQSVAGSCCSTSCRSSSTQGGHRTERLPVKQPESEAALLPSLSREASWAPSQQSLQLEGCNHFHPHCFCSTFQEVQGRRKWWMWGHRLPEPLWELVCLIPNFKGTGV